MTYTPGTDVSRYNDDGKDPKIDFRKMASKGIQFVVVRLTSGKNLDRDIDYNCKGVVDAGMILIGYHWWNYTVARSAQMDVFLEAYRKYSVSYPALDIENFGSTPMPQGAASVNTVDAMMQDILVGTGKKCLIYSNGDILKNYLTPKPAGWYDYPLWLAAPGTTPPKNLYGWKNWTMWQYTGKLYGPDYGVGAEAKDLDGNYFNGSLDDLKKFCGIETSPPVEVPTVESRLSALETAVRNHGWDI